MGSTDSLPDGFRSAKALRDERKSEYAEKLSAGREVYRIRFKLLGTKGHAAAKAARRSVKAARSRIA